MTTRHSPPASAVPAPPPAFSRWLLQRALPADVRTDVAGDLAEVFQRDVATVGLSRARRLYRRKVRSFVRHFLRERLRESFTGLMSARLSALDFRLGGRMLARYPGLTIVGGLALAFAIAVGVSCFTFISSYLSPTLPLDEGDRIVAVRQMDANTSDPEERVTYDFARWQSQFTSVVELGAIRDRLQNLVVDGAEGDPIRAASLTTTAFHLARVAPLLGRGLLEADERAGTPSVVVIGHALWQTRFSGAPGVVGTTVTLDGLPAAELRAIDFFFRMTLGISAIALGLSLASIYAVMAFAVSRRTREIGIRIALGSERSRVVLAILRRPLAQVSTGLCAGLLMTTWMVNEVYGRSLSPAQWSMILGYGLLMLLVCLLACVVPARRALSVQPTEALRTD